MAEAATAPRTPAHVLIPISELPPLQTVPGEVATIAYQTADDGDLAMLGHGELRAGVVFDQPTDVPTDVAPDMMLLLFLPGDETQPQWERASAYAGAGASRRRVAVTIRQSDTEVFDRLRGVFESDALRDKCVAVIGCGSGGSYVLRELVRAGVGRFLLIDHDRLEAANVCRHELGLSDIGRLKVNALRDYILDRNPQATISTGAFRVEGSSLTRLTRMLDDARPDVVVCGTDNRESRLLVNRATVLSGTVTLYGGVRRRAYAGQVLHVIPRLTPCYQCFVKQLPAVVADKEISSPEDARQVAYSDRPVNPEPGLSTDIAPIALMLAKLALLELTHERPPSIFDSLREDLVASWYLWLNRREAGTPFAKWPPLQDRVGGAGILRWVGQFLDRDLKCPACGETDMEVSPEDMLAFGESEDAAPCLSPSDS